MAMYWMTENTYIEWFCECGGLVGVVWCPRQEQSPKLPAKPPYSIFGHKLYSFWDMLMRFSCSKNSFKKSLGVCLGDISLYLPLLTNL